ncbi:asparagine synthase (glutamine-hydrolyzing) [Streptomyces sioyaensis]|uniref:asparagine synthase (glutamine-hydrolyzing) n=1 Tax=Streptomyces sioyaensis TaxID=67364 RepID=UPI003401C537
MCGIAGIFGPNDEQMLKRMGDSIAHRGPDGEGRFVSSDAERPWGMVHRRLAVIDREGGQQPFVTEDERFVVCYNGEIYNFRELRAELENAGRQFRTKCDTEVAAQAFAEWGEGALDRFNGMFALAIYDAAEHALYLARDHFGIKPLYFAEIGKDVACAPRVVFGSEIKAILSSGLVEPAPDDVTLYRYLRFRVHEEGDRTFFAGIGKVRPGELVVVRHRGIERRSFTTLREDLLSGTRKPYHELAADEFRILLTSAICSRLVSEVPVGSALSGGLDSSTVVVTVSQLMSQQARDAESVGQTQNSFSAVFPGAVNDEERYVDIVTEQCPGPVSVHKVLPNPDQFLTDLRDFVRTQEEPVISTGPYAQYKVMEEASKYVTVMLDGQGADEMMAGYLPYYFVYLRQLRRQRQWSTLAREMLGARDVLAKYGLERLWTKTRRRQAVDSCSVLASEFTRQHQSQSFRPVEDNLRARLVEDIFHNSLPSLLRYEDRNTMRFSLEGRVPFLNHRLLRYLFSLDDEALVKEGWNKRVLRDAVRGRLPKEITDRRNKIGFTTPERDWFLRIKNHVHEVFRSERFGSRPYFDQAAVLRAFEGFIAGRNTDTMLFWRLLNVELWMQEYIDEKPQQKSQCEESGVKEILAPNPGKEIGITTPAGRVMRYPVSTGVFENGDDLPGLTALYVQQFVAAATGPDSPVPLKQPWFLAISEKAVAITQGRSYCLWEIKPGRAARLLSKRVSRTPAGIGLGMPETMQLAISEAGLPRILAATVVGGVGKAIGRKGWFYRVAGKNVRAIDGPTQYSLPPSNVSAKLAPKAPEKVAADIASHLRATLPAETVAAFQGVAIIDANDLGCDVLGQSTELPDACIAEMFRDNPLGQGRQCTPLAMVIKPSTTAGDHATGYPADSGPHRFEAGTTERARDAKAQEVQS